MVVTGGLGIVVLKGGVGKTSATERVERADGRVQ